MIAAALAPASNVPIAGVPPLRSHQRDALASLKQKLQGVWDRVALGNGAAAAQAGWIIALDMRTGKTPTAIRAIVNFETDWIAQAPLLLRGAFSHFYLVIAPSAPVARQWQDEWMKFTTAQEREQVGQARYVRNDSKKFAKELPGIMKIARVIIITWSTLRTRRQVLAGIRWRGIIADELHHAGNEESGRTQALWSLDSLWRLGLTGTPYTNKISQLWPVLSWLHGDLTRVTGRKGHITYQRRSSLWADKETFEGRFVISGTTASGYKTYLGGWNLRHGDSVLCKGHTEEDCPCLQPMLTRHAMFRRAYSDCEAPPKEQRVWLQAVPLSTQEKALYQQVQEMELQVINAQGKEKTLTLKYVLERMQVGFGMLFCPEQYRAYLAKKGLQDVEARPSSKARYIADQLANEAGGKVLVQTAYAAGMEAFADEIHRYSGKRMGCLKGGMKDTEQIDLIRRWKLPEEDPTAVDVLVMDKVGAEGLDLAAARYVFVAGFLDYRPGMVQQMIERSTSMFKTGGTNIAILYAPETLEQWLYEEYLPWKTRIFERAIEATPTPQQVDEALARAKEVLRSTIDIKAAWGGGAGGKEAAGESE